MPTHGRPDGSGLCDDEGDVAQYLGMDAFFNLKRSVERPGAGAQRAAQTKKQLRRSVRIYREVKDKAGRNGLPCPFYTV